MILSASTPSRTAAELPPIRWECGICRTPVRTAESTTSNIAAIWKNCPAKFGHIIGLCYAPEVRRSPAVCEMAGLKKMPVIWVTQGHTPAASREQLAWVTLPAHSAPDYFPRLLAISRTPLRFRSGELDGGTCNAATARDETTFRGDVRGLRHDDQGDTGWRVKVGAGRQASPAGAIRFWRFSRHEIRILPNARSRYASPVSRNCSPDAPVSRLLSTSALRRFSTRFHWRNYLCR